MPGVIVGVDNSKPARAALEWAVRYAQQARLPVTVVTVVDPMLATALWDANPQHNTHEAVLAAARDEARQMVDEAVADTGTFDVDIDVRAIAGHPVRELTELACDADLLVVGSRGAGPLSRLLLGSTSAGVAHNAPCSVMIVNPQYHAARTT